MWSHDSRDASLWGHASDGSDTLVMETYQWKKELLIRTGVLWIFDTSSLVGDDPELDPSIPIRLVATDEIWQVGAFHIDLPLESKSSP